MADPPREPAYRRAGFDTPYAYAKARKQAKTWSDKSSRSEASRFDPSYSGEKFRAYYDTYPSPVSGSKVRRSRGGRSRKLKKWLVDVGGFYTKEEYDERYPVYE